jgi:hypothetical protein
MIVTRNLSPASWRKLSEIARTANFVPELTDRKCLTRFSLSRLVPSSSGSFRGDFPSVLRAQLFRACLAALFPAKLPECLGMRILLFHYA